MSLLFWFFVFIVLVVFAGVRDWSVGTDTLNYRDMFVYKQDVPINLLTIFSGLEPGFAVFQRIMQNLTTSFNIYLFSIAAFVISLYQFVIRKFSKGYGISVFIFITLGTYLFFFNGARQAMAAAIVALAFIPLIKGKMIQYGLIISLAILFHKTAIVLLPMYFVFRMPFSVRQLVYLLALTAVITLGLSFIMSFSPDLISEKLADYHNRTSGGGELLMLVYMLMTLTFIIVRRYITEEDLKQYDLYLNLSIYTTFIYLMVNVAGQDVNMIRFTLYAAPGFMFIWPLIFKHLPIFRSIVPWALFFIFHLLFFYIYINKMIGPYKLHPQFV